MTYSVRYTLKNKDVNLHRKLRTSALFELLQEASIAHTEELGMGREMTLDRGFLWVVLQQRADIARMPEMVHNLLTVLHILNSFCFYYVFPKRAHISELFHYRGNCFYYIIDILVCRFVAY